MGLMASLSQCPTEFGTGGQIKGLQRRLTILLFFMALLTGFAVEDGDISSIDASRRLQVTHALWTDEPPVRDGDYPEFGVVGRNGVIHAWYGIGQSLVMFPADMVSSLLLGETMPDPASVKGRIKHAFIVYATFPLITAACVVFGFHLLLLLNFQPTAAATGTIGMLFGTTLLQWTQVNQENNLTLLCFLALLLFCLRWFLTGHLGNMIGAGAAAGFALLVRLPTIFETAFAGLFMAVLLFAFRDAHGKAKGRGNWLQAAGIFGAVFGLFVVAERLYQWVRFGSFTNTYIGAHQLQNPDFYVGGDWWRGVWTLLFSGYDSALWMDPGILLFALLLIFYFWRVSRDIKTLGFCLFALLLTLIAFYAPYPWPGGASGWGSRYTTTPAIMLGLLGFGLMAHLWPRMGKTAKIACGILTAYALAAQIGSLLFWSNLEQVQWAAWGREYFLVGQRWLNFATVLGGEFCERRLMVPEISERLLRVNFMPFHVYSQFGVRAGAVALAAWGMLLAGILGLLVAIWKALTDNSRVS